MWGKLVVLCVLVLAMVADAEAHIPPNKTYHEQTTGKSGVVCTKIGRKCVSFAECVNKHCVCPAPQKGFAEIECVGQDEHLCTITGDPHIRAFGGAMATIALPCRYRAAKFGIKNKHSSTGSGACDFDVYATNEIQHGRYVVRSVHIAVWIAERVEHTKYPLNDYKTAEYSVNDTEIYDYQAHVAHLKSVWINPKKHLEGVTPTFDDVNNFAILESPECETRIKFRAFDRTQGLRQKQLPGLSIQAPSHAEWTPGYGDYPYACCGTPADSHALYTDRARELGVDDDNTAILYDILKQAPVQGDHEQQFQCNQAFELFKTSADKAKDVNECAFLLTKVRVARCIQTNDLQPIQVFNACLNVQQNTGKGCSVLKRAAESCGSHSDWKGPKNC